MILYNDRVIAWRKGREISSVIDFKPSLDNIRAIIECDKRNIQAQAELVHYNRHHEFLNKHPLLLSRTQTNKLLNLRRLDPDEFLAKLHLTAQNIARYQSQINNRKYNSREELTRWNNLIAKHSNTLQLMKSVLSFE